MESGKDDPSKPGWASWTMSKAVCPNGATTFGSKYDGPTGSKVTNVANTTGAAAVGTAGRAAADNAATVDADDDIVATNRTNNATNDDAYVAGTHDGAAAAIRHTESVRIALLTGRRKF